MIASALRFFGAPNWIYLIFFGLIVVLPFAYVAYRIVGWFRGRRYRAIYKEYMRDEEQRKRQEAAAATTEEARRNEERRRWQEEQQREQAQWQKEQRRRTAEEGGHRRAEQEQKDPGHKEKLNRGTYDPFKVLGVTEIASEAEVKNAWRHKCNIWHPDKFSPEQGNDPTFKKMINDKMSEVNNAYDEIKRRKGWR
ncbi:MAG: DnaJ domain-containing protein [Candidatus Bathyarchaeota archaeon]|nr:DnaJ domain-containing protein [Candidatus Termiticorpusculum sp.]